MGILDRWRPKSVEKRAQSWIDSVEFQVVNDGFANPITGVGAMDRAQQVSYIPDRQLNYHELSDLVDMYWLARRCVRALPEAAHQDRIAFKRAADQEIWDKINRLEGNDDGAFLTACIWARTHGASILIKGQQWGGNPESPALEGAPVEWLEPIRVEDFSVYRSDLNQNVNDPRNFGKPEYYRITGFHRFQGLRIHRSRVIHFAGPTLSDPEHSRDIEKMVQLSALDPIYEVLRQYSLSWSALSDMMQQGSVPIWTIKGLLNGLKQNVQDVQDRMAIQNAAVSINKAIMLDADSNENYRREAVSFAEIPEVMKQMSLQVSAAGGIPVSELFGRIVSGLGDTGDVEDEKWARKIGVYRTCSLEPRIEQILPGADYDWAPIKIPTPIEKADLHRKWWDMGAVLDKETRSAAEESIGLAPLDEAGAQELKARNGSSTTPPIFGSTSTERPTNGETPAGTLDPNSPAGSAGFAG